MTAKRKARKIMICFIGLRFTVRLFLSVGFSVGDICRDDCPDDAGNPDEDEPEAEGEEPDNCSEDEHDDSSSDSGIQQAKRAEREKEGDDQALRLGYDDDCLLLILIFHV